MQGWSPLLSAVSSGHDDIVKLLLSLGAEVERANDQGRTPLHYAVRSIQADSSQLQGRQALKHQAGSVSRSAHAPMFRPGIQLQRKQQLRPGVLWLAVLQASKGRPSLVRLLLANGAQVNVKDCTGATPLHRCGGSCHCSALARKVYGRPHAHSAAPSSRPGNAGTVASNLLLWRRWLSKRAGQSRLFIFSIPVLLVSCSVPSLRSLCLRRPFTCRCMGTRRVPELQHPDFAAGPHLCWTTATAVSCLLNWEPACLCRAASAGRTEALRVLIEEGHAKVDARNKEGATPLLLAAQSGCQPAALYLASRGADVEVRRGRVARQEAHAPSAVV